MTGGVDLYPAIDTMLGGNKIFIQGPCYDIITSNVVCKFENTLSGGTVESSLRAFCVSPTLFTAGDVAVHVSLDGGTTFPYTGHLQVGKYQKVTVDTLTYGQGKCVPNMSSKC